MKQVVVHLAALSTSHRFCGIVEKLLSPCVPYLSCIVFGSSPAPSPSKKFKLCLDPFDAVRVASSIQELQRQARRCANKFANCSLSLSLFCLTASGASQGLPPLERPQCSTKAQGRCFLPPIHSQILATATLCFGYCSFANHLARTKCCEHQSIPQATATDN